MAKGLDSLWAVLNVPEGYPLNWFARSASGILGGAVNSPSSLVQLLRNMNQTKADTYFGLNHSLTRNRLRLRERDITMWSNVLLDLDPQGAGALDDPGKAAQSFALKAKELLGCDFSPSIIDSGRGVQVLLHLEPQLITSDSGRGAVRSAVRAFIKKLSVDLPESGPTPPYRLDTSCSDLSRLARMPYTFNSKTGRTTRVLAVGQQSALLSRSILEVGRGVVESIPIRPRQEGGRWQEVFHLLTRTAQLFLCEGAALGERHRVVVATVRSLRENGVPLQDVERQIVSANLLGQDPLPECEVLRIVRQQERTRYA